MSPKVRVPQSEGDITIAANGDEPRTYKVTDGTVTVAEADLPTFLGAVEGSSVEAKTASSTSKEK